MIIKIRGLYYMVIAAIIANAVLYLWMKTLYNDYLCLVS